MQFVRWAFLLLLVGGVGCTKVPVSTPVEGVILVVSDGTSLELLTAARVYSAGANGSLALNELAHSAVVKTYSRSHAVTDSAAAATALARGVKADNLVVGMAGALDEAGPPSILDLARKEGWSTGVISDDAVTGATPSAFLVEHPRRTQYAAIAGKMVEQLGPRADIVLGGGAKWFSADDEAAIYPEGDKGVVEKTQARLKEKGVRVFRDWEVFKAETAGRAEGAAILGVFYPEVFPFYTDGGRTLRLKDMVAETVRIFQARKKPFLLVVEAGLPDKASHLNNAKRAMTEVLECDAVIAWVREKLPNVLLLVTTDHNTGGLSINGYPPLAFKGDALLRPDPLMDRSILTWASGPGGSPETANVRTTTVQEPGQPQRQVEEPKQPTDYDYVQPALLATKSALHTGGDVWLLADGPGAERVHGTMDNTEVFRVMAEAISGKR